MSFIPVVGTRILLASTLQGFGMGLRSLILNAGQMLFAVSLAWGMSSWFGLNGTWWGMTTGNALAALLGVVWILMILRTIEGRVE